MKTATVYDRMVECPHCRETFEVQQAPRGSGATYVRKWEKIPPQLAGIMAAWISDQRMLTHAVTKVQARRMLAENGMTLTENAASARLSELLGLGMIRIAKREERETATYTGSAPQYMINTRKALNLINSGGYL